MRNVRLVNTIGSGLKPHMKELRRQRCVALMMVWGDILPQLAKRGVALHVDPCNCAFTLKGIQDGAIRNSG